MGGPRPRSEFLQGSRTKGGAVRRIRSGEKKGPPQARKFFSGVHEMGVKIGGRVKKRKEKKKKNTHTKKPHGMAFRKKERSFSRSRCVYYYQFVEIPPMENIRNTKEAMKMYENVRK